MPFKQRILIFGFLWLLAGVLCAIFADVTIEAGESEFFTRLKLIYLAPLISAIGTAFTLVHGHYDTWQQRDQYQTVIVWLLLAAFVIHAIVALTRKTRRQFIALAAVQAFFLAVSVSCVLHFFHYDATHGHG